MAAALVFLTVVWPLYHCRVIGVSDDTVSEKRSKPGTIFYIMH